MRIDCDDCAMQHTTACDDCIVTALLDRPSGTAVVLDLDEARAVRALQRAGLAPRSRYLPIQRAVDQQAAAGDNVARWRADRPTT